MLDERVLLESGTVGTVTEVYSDGSVTVLFFGENGSFLTETGFIQEVL